MSNREPSPNFEDAPLQGIEDVMAQIDAENPDLRRGFDDLSRDERIADCERKILAFVGIGNPDAKTLRRILAESPASHPTMVNVLTNLAVKATEIQGADNSEQLYATLDNLMRMAHLTHVIARASVGELELNKVELQRSILKNKFLDTDNKRDFVWAADIFMDGETIDLENPDNFFKNI